MPINIPVHRHLFCTGVINDACLQAPVDNIKQLHDKTAVVTKYGQNALNLLVQAYVKSHVY